MLPIVDEYTRECLTIEVERHLTAKDVESTMEYMFEVRGGPEHIRSDNGPESIAEVVTDRLARRGAETPYIEPGSPRENVSSETSNSRLRNEILDREVFETLEEAKVPLEAHRLDYRHRRPRSLPRYRAPAEFAAACHRPDSASLRPAEARSVPDPVLS